MKALNNLVISLSILLFHSQLFPVAKGSEIAVSIQPFYTFPEDEGGILLGVPNRMLGFGWFKNGFALENSATSCTFESVYPVSGTVNLNGGTLYLAQDLIFKNVTNLQGLGKIIGNNHIIDLCSSIEALPSSTQEFEDVSLFLASDLQVTSTITFRGSCYINGGGNTINLGTPGAFVIDDGATLYLKNVKITGLSGENIACASDASSLVLDGVIWRQDGDFVFKKGSITFVDITKFAGKYSFTYQSLQSSFIASKSVWSVQGNLALHIAKQAGGQEPLVCQDATAQWILNNCTLTVDQGGMSFTNGRVSCFGEVFIDVVSTDTSNGFVLGNGDAQYDPIVEINPGTVVTFNSGHVVWDIVHDANVRFLSRDSWIKRTAQSKFHLKHNLTMGNVTIDSSPYAVTTLANNAVMQYNGALFASIYGVTIVKGQHYAPGTTLMRGNDAIFLINGSLPSYTVVQGTGNVISGNGSIIGAITLLNSSAEVTINIDGSITQNITLNGGTLKIGSGLKFDADKTIFDSGTVDIASSGFYLGPVASTWSGNITWKGNGGSILLNAQTTLNGTWKFENDCTLQGNGNILDMSNGRIEIADGVKLTLRDVQVIGIQDTSIQCLGADSSLVLDDVIWVQSDIYTFDTGSIRFVHDVDFLGSYTFSYDSNQTSTIALKSTWHISDHMWFSVGRNNGVEPLYFEDETSTLFFDNCTHHVTSGGMRPTNGRLMYARDVAVIVNSFDEGNCLELGNGNSAQDMIFEFAPGSTVHFETGLLIYNNVDSARMISRSTTARLERTANTAIHIKQSVKLANLTIDTSPYATTTVDAGKTFLYENCIVVLPTGIITVTGDRHNPITNLLNGNDSVFLSTGQLSMNTLVTGQENTIYGNGSVVAPITLLDSSAELILGLNGSLAAPITLNGGTLKLNSAVRFDGNHCIEDYGTVHIGGSSLGLGSLDIDCAGDIHWQGVGGSLVLRSQVSLQGTWTFSGHCTLQGNGNVLDLSKGGHIEISPGSVLTLRDVQLVGIYQDSVKCLGDDSAIRLDDVYWVQTGDVIFNKGSLLFINDVDFVGSHLFSYETVQTSTILHNSQWRITDHMKLCIGKNSGVEPLFFEDSTATLSLDNCGLHIGSGGMQIINGRVLYSRDVSLDIASTNTQHCLVLGNGDPAHDMVFEYNPGTSVSINSGHMVYDVVSDGNVISRSTTARLRRTAASAIHIKQNLFLSNLTIDISPYATTTFEQGTDLAYENCIFILPTGIMSITGERQDAITNLLDGNKSIFLTTGQLGMHTLVKNFGNNIYGNGLISGPIVLADNNAALTLSVDGVIAGDITLNGGKVILGQDAQFNSQKQFRGSGVVDLRGSILSFGSHPAEWDGDIYYEAESGIIQLHADVTLSGKLTFSGNVVLEANGHTLNLIDDGEIVIENGSTLRLKDVTIKGVSGTNIRCKDHAANLILDNVGWVQNDDYTFLYGKLAIRRNVVMSGEDTAFIYNTDQEASIFSYASLTLAQQFTFNYNPSSGVTNLLCFEDPTSLIILDGATLQSAQGLVLSRGSVVIKNDSFFATADDTIGLTLGMGDITSDCKLYINSGMTLSVNHGVLNYRNIGTKSLIMGNSVSSLFMADNTTLRIYENITAENGSIKFGNNATLVRSLEKTILGDVICLGQLTIL